MNSRKRKLSGWDRKKENLAKKMCEESQMMSPISNFFPRSQYTSTVPVTFSETSTVPDVSQPGPATTVPDVSQPGPDVSQPGPATTVPDVSQPGPDVSQPGPATTVKRQTSLASFFKPSQPTARNITTAPTPASTTAAAPTPASTLGNSSSLASATDIDDIGNVDVQRLRICNMTDSAKLKLLQSRFKADKAWTPPLRECGDKMRRVPNEFFNEAKYPTLRYSVSQDGIYCVVCMLFASGDITLRTRPLQDWKNGKRIVDKHMCTDSHRNAQQRAAQFSRICSGSQSTVTQSLSKSHAEQTSKNRSNLKAIVKAIVLCGKQNIAIRGHADNRSNLVALLNYRAEIDETLRSHMTNGPKNASYIGHSIQNEIIELCGAQVRQVILERCQAAIWYSLLVDESADVSCAEQVSICLRYVEEKNDVFQLREDFVGFCMTRDTKGETLADIVLNALTGWNIDPAKMVGQGYDGAANMSGSRSGVQAIIQRQYPAAVYVHCRNHCLNLAIVHSCRLAPVRNMLNIVKELVYFISASPQRLQVFLEKTDDKHRLKMFSETRWSQHDACLSTLLDKYEEIVNALDSLQQVSDPKTRATASSLSHSMDNFDFLVACIVCQKLLQYLTPLSNFLQDPSCNLIKASASATKLVNFLKEKRGAFRQFWESCTAYASKYNVVVSVHRVVQRQCHRSNVAADTPEDYWRLNLFIPFIDYMISQVSERLCNPIDRLQAQYLLPCNIAGLTEETWKAVKQEYAVFLSSPDSIDGELEMWRHNASNNTENDVLHLLQQTKYMYPNIHSILKVLLTMPVSTATAERTFSCMRRLKTYLRNTMSEDRMSSLALLNIHYDIDIDTDAIVRDFTSCGTRRMNFL